MKFLSEKLRNTISKYRQLISGVCLHCWAINGWDAVFEDDRCHGQVRLQFECQNCGRDIDQWVDEE